MTFEFQEQKLGCISGTCLANGDCHCFAGFAGKNCDEKAEIQLFENRYDESDHGRSSQIWGSDGFDQGLKVYFGGTMNSAIFFKFNNEITEFMNRSAKS